MPVVADVGLRADLPAAPTRTRLPALTQPTRLRDSLHRCWVTRRSAGGANPHPPAGANPTHATRRIDVGLRADLPAAPTRTRLPALTQPTRLRDCTRPRLRSRQNVS